MYWFHPHDAGIAARHWGARFQRRFEAGFERFRQGYHRLLEGILRGRPRRFAAGVYGIVLLSFLLLPWIGQNFFPEVDAGQIKLHLRAPTGTRIEDTTALCDRVEQDIRRHLNGQLAKITASARGTNR